MRNRFDLFSKDVLAECFAEAGEVETQREITTESQWADLWFRPGPRDLRHTIHSVPVLSTIAKAQAIVEPFHRTPQSKEILSCVAKQLAMFSELTRKDEHSRMPRLWIVSSGRPDSAIEQLGFVPMGHAVSGLYRAPRGFALQLVVISELPVTRDTLLLRLMGAGRTFDDALQEFKRLPADAWEVKVALARLIRYRFEIGSLAETERTAEEKAIMAAQELYEQWERERIALGEALGEARGEAQGEARGKALGLAEGMAPLVRQFARRLGRQLSEAERVTLRERLATLGPDRLGDVVLDLTPEELAAWVADPAAR